MSKVSAVIEQEPHKTLVRTGKHSLVSDVDAQLGGLDTGMSPKELLASSLIACTCITMKIYADRNTWNVNNIKVDADISLDLNSGATVIHKYIQIEGDLTEEQKNKLYKIASSCPVHKLLAPSAVITSTLINE